MHDNDHRKELERVGMTGFFNITKAWGLSEEERRTLLGTPNVETFLAWQRGEIREIPSEIFERISHVFAIYKALRTVFPSEDRANAWIKKPNQAFQGKQALEVMLQGNLSEVRKYLDAQCV